MFSKSLNFKCSGAGGLGLGVYISSQARAMRQGTADVLQLNPEGKGCENFRKKRENVMSGQEELGRASVTSQTSWMLQHLASLRCFLFSASRKDDSQL
jgi:hypothetical protein